jgi:hypothetical protein
MKNIDENTLKKRVASVLPTLNEYQRRRYLSAEAKSIGYGGISIVSRLSGVSRQTLTAGVKELENTDAEPMKQGRSRKPGSGRKELKADKSQDNIVMKAKTGRGYNGISAGKMSALRKR